MNRKTLLSLFAVVLLASFVSACSSSHHQTPPPVLSIAITTAPPSSLEVSQSASVTATVSNDSASGGVDWTLSCTSSDCGSIAPAHTDSGTSTTYTAPSVVPTGGSVTITAASTTDPTTTAAANVTINALGSNEALAAGNQYAFFVSGVDDAGGFYTAAGSFTSNGDGTLVDGGVEDYVNVPNVIEADTLTDGTYAIGPDGRGTITFTANFGGVPDTNIGNAGVQSFTVVGTSNFVATGSHLLIVEADGFATSSGTVDLQNSGDFAAGLVGSYVFTLAGEDADNGFVATTFGGVAVTDGAGNITGVLDSNDAATGFVDGADLTGATYTAPDANGRGIISFNNADQQNMAYYMVNAKVLRLVELDDINFTFFTGGSAYAAATASGFDTSALNGSFVMLEGGQEAAVGAVSIGGQFTTDGGGNITAGVNDANENGLLSTATAVVGTYTVPDAAFPRVLFDITGGNSGAIEFVYAYLADPTINLLDPNNASGTAGALVMDSDVTANGTGYLIAQDDPTGTAFVGNYGQNIQLDPQVNDEVDISAQGASDGSGIFAGTADLATIGATQAGDAMELDFTADGTNPGRFTGLETFDPAGAINVILYQVTNAQLISVGGDEASIGVILSQ